MKELVINNDVTLINSLRREKERGGGEKEWKQEEDGGGGPARKISKEADMKDGWDF